MTSYFVSITGPGDRRTTVTREAENALELMDALDAEFGAECQFDWSDPTSGRSSGDIRRDIIDSMDLPDGAWLQMHEDMGMDPY